VPTDEWVELDLDGNFKVQIPADATPSLREEGSSAVIRLDPLGDSTEVLISNGPLAKAADDRVQHAGALRDAVADFFNRTVANAVMPFTIDVGEEGIHSFAQGVGLLEKNRVLLARAYARRGEDRFWLLHWHGPKDKMAVVLRILVTFDPAE
jgi:hypothetical protein